MGYYKEWKVTLIDKDNSTCVHKSVPNYGEAAVNDVVLENSNNGEYLWTKYPLTTYYKPKDAFVCCYLSPKYGQMYADGYGLNFYTREYGYYEYCEPASEYDNLLA